MWEEAGFPSPLEVDRFISRQNTLGVLHVRVFPSPLEVDRFISKRLEFLYLSFNVFPSPLEVDRFISTSEIEGEINNNRFRPLSR